MTLWLLGSMVTESMLVVEISGSSVSTDHVVELLQQLVVFHTPPPTVAAYATMLPFVVVVGSTVMLFTRPCVVV